MLLINLNKLSKKTVLYRFGFSLFSAFSIFFSLVFPVASEGFDDSKIMHLDYPDWFIEDSFYELADDLENAVSSGKKGLMVLFTTEGCAYCDMFIKKSLGDPIIAGLVQDNFDVIGLEIFDDADLTHPNGTATTVKQFAKSEGAEFSPTILFYGKNGNRFLKLVGYQKPAYFKNVMSFIEIRKPKEKFREYLKRRSLSFNEKVSYQLKTDSLFESPPFFLDRSRFEAEKPLVVIFESNDCRECKNFHVNVLASPDVRAALEKFEVVRLNSRDEKTPVMTPDGKKLTAADWYENTGFTRLPAVMFFSKQGDNVLKSDALILRQRMMNSIGFVIDKAYLQDWTYQRYARTRALERLNKKTK